MVNPVVRETALTLGASGFRADLTVALEARAALLMACITAFGRVIGEVGVDVGGYFCELERTLIVGKPMPKQKRYFEAMLKAQDAAFAAFGPSAKCSDIDKAVLLAEESAALDRKTRNMTSLSFSMNELGWLNQIFGEWDKSEQYHKEAVGISQRLDDFQSIASSCGRLGWLHFDKGEYAKAAECIAKSIEIEKEHELEPRFWDYNLVITCIELKEIEKANKLLEEFDKFVHGLDSKLYMLRADFCRAMLLRAEKKWDESIDQFETILKEWETMNPRRWDVYDYGRSTYEYARVFLDRDEKGDKEKADNVYKGFKPLSADDIADAFDHVPECYDLF
jgi:tetratricopeptide (TPR) repeat protein